MKRVLYGLHVNFLMFIAFLAISFSANSNPKDTSVYVPLGGNTWQKGTLLKPGCITDKGIENWQQKETSFETYIRVNATGSLHLQAKARANGKTVLRITINHVQKQFAVTGNGEGWVEAGSWNITDTGYLKITLEGISKTGDAFAEVEAYQVSGSAINAATAYVKNNDGNFFYWGRRGPSVHLNYPFADSIKAEWFYNEVTVPAGQDVTGSYFMADGFGEGYFGMQVNSASERRILFSVWSPFTTDDPKSIPEDMQVKMLKKGTTVHAGEFGNEGSGGQSYMRYGWKAGTTYRFLLHGRPDGDSSTTYTAYFYAPEEKQWLLLASFKRPKTNTYLKGFHSFLENFIPEQGDSTRKVFFSNQWIRDISNQWLPLSTARFTYDNTAAHGYRKDYAGGVENGAFYLKNCGFFNESTAYKTMLHLSGHAEKTPEINFDQLP